MVMVLLKFLNFDLVDNQKQIILKSGEFLNCSNVSSMYRYGATFLVIDSYSRYLFIG